MKDPVEGTATLVSYNETNLCNEFDTTIHAQVVVTADGLEPTAVDAFFGIPNSQLPLMPGVVFDVRVDRSNPEHVQLLNDAKKDRAKAQAASDAGRAQAEQLAAQMRGGAPSSPGAGVVSGMPGVQILGADSPQVQAAMAAAAEQLQQVLGTASGANLGAPVVAGQPSSEPDAVSKLERLAKLRDQGVLSDAEFEVQKDKIIGSS
jgi:hypothetical protein